MPQEVNGTDINQRIDRHIQKTNVFLHNYLKTTHEGPLRLEDTNQIAQLISLTVDHGTREQQRQLYLMLIGTRAQLRYLQHLRQPIVELTRFFQSKSPIETKNFEDALKTPGVTVAPTA